MSRETGGVGNAWIRQTTMRLERLLLNGELLDPCGELGDGHPLEAVVEAEFNDAEGRVGLPRLGALHAEDAGVDGEGAPHKGRGVGEAVELVEEEGQLQTCRGCG